MKMEITGIADVNKVLESIAPKEAKNLMRATVHDVAGQLAKSGKKNARHRSGKLKKGIKAKRERGTRDTIESTVRSSAIQWRFEEYGQGPDGVEVAMFLKALQAMRPNMDRIYLESFVKKLEARLARLRKAAAK